MRKLALVLLTSLLGVLLFTEQALAVNKTTIDFHNTEMEPISDAEFLLYQVSTKDIAAEHPTIIVDAGGFETYSGSRSVAKAELQQTIEDLDAHVTHLSLEPVEKAFTDDKGLINFYDLPTGVYLVKSTPRPMGLEPAEGYTLYRTYDSVPFLLFVPQETEVAPKAMLTEERIPDKPGTTDPEPDDPTTTPDLTPEPDPDTSSPKPDTQDTELPQGSAANDSATVINQKMQDTGVVAGGVLCAVSGSGALGALIARKVRNRDKGDD